MDPQKPIVVLGHCSSHIHTTMRVSWKQAVLGFLPAAALVWNCYALMTRPDPEHLRIPTPQETHTGALLKADVPDTKTPPEQGQNPPQSPQEEGRTKKVDEPPPTVAEEVDTAVVVTRGPGIVQLNFMGRLGNNLFEYAAARALADRLGWALSVQPAPANEKKFGLLTRPEGMACFPGVRPVGPPPSSPEMASLETVKFRGVRRELEDPAPRSIEMEGWFQDYGLFSSEKERLRKVLIIICIIWVGGWLLKLSFCF